MDNVDLSIIMERNQPSFPLSYSGFSPVMCVCLSWLQIFITTLKCDNITGQRANVVCGKVKQLMAKGKTIVPLSRHYYIM